MNKQHNASRFSRPLVIAASMFFVGWTAPAAAQTGVIAFRDDCTARLYAMRGDGSGRIVLPLPPLLLPDDQYRQPLVLDVTTSGPPTVVYYVGMAHAPPAGLYDFGLFAVQVEDTGGGLSALAPVRLSLPILDGINPNTSRRGSFSPMGIGDRLALVTPDASLLTARIERDLNSKITGLTDPVVVGDLFDIADVPPSSSGFTGDIDYSPVAGIIVASIQGDLWRIYLGADNTLLDAHPLTDTDNFAEWNPAFSPDGNRIAYTGGAMSSSGGVSGRDADIYSLNLASLAALRVTNNKNKGDAAEGRNNGRWSPDGASIGFSAYTGSRVPRSSPCSGLVNSDLFLIEADGSSVATRLTDTHGTSVETWPRWGW